MPVGAIAVVVVSALTDEYRGRRSEAQKQRREAYRNADMTIDNIYSVSFEVKETALKSLCCIAPSPPRFVDMAIAQANIRKHW